LWQIILLLGVSGQPFAGEPQESPYIGTWHLKLPTENTENTEGLSTYRLSTFLPTENTENTELCLVSLFHFFTFPLTLISLAGEPQFAPTLAPGHYMIIPVSHRILTT